MAPTSNQPSIAQTIQTAGNKRPVAKKPAKKAGFSVNKATLAQLKKLDMQVDSRLGEKN